AGGKLPRKRGRPRTPAAQRAARQRERLQRKIKVPVTMLKTHFFFGASLARPSVAQELAAQVIGVNSFALPGEPSGVDREIIGQLPSGFCVATRKSIPRLISGRSAEKPASAKTYKVWPVAKASLRNSGTVWLQPPSARCRASS